MVSWKKNICTFSLERPFVRKEPWCCNVCLGCRLLERRIGWFHTPWLTLVLTSTTNHNYQGRTRICQTHRPEMKMAENQYLWKNIGMQHFFILLWPRGCCLNSDEPSPISFTRSRSLKELVWNILRWELKISGNAFQMKCSMLNKVT